LQLFRNLGTILYDLFTFSTSVYERPTMIIMKLYIATYIFLTIYNRSSVSLKLSDSISCRNEHISYYFVFRFYTGNRKFLCINKNILSLLKGYTWFAFYISLQTNILSNQTKSNTSILSNKINLFSYVHMNLMSNN